MDDSERAQLRNKLSDAYKGLNSYEAELIAGLNEATLKMRYYEHQLENTRTAKEALNAVTSGFDTDHTHWKYRVRKGEVEDA